MVPVVFTKKGVAEQGRAVGILGEMVKTATMGIRGRKLETKMRNLLTDELIGKLWHQRNNRQNMLTLLQGISEAHRQLEYWHLVGLGQTELNHMVGEVQTYPQIMGETLGEEEDLKEWELRPNGKKLDIGIALRERRQDEETRHQIEEQQDRYNQWHAWTKDVRNASKKTI